MVTPNTAHTNTTVQRPIRQRPVSPAVAEAAAFLLLYSCCILMEGTVRLTVNCIPETMTNTDDSMQTMLQPTIPRSVLITAGGLEVLVGTAGIVLGVWTLVFHGSNNTASSSYTTFICLIMQASPISWFVYAVFVVAAPLLASRQTTGLWDWTQREHAIFLLIGQGLGSMTFCWALQGGQFVFMARLWVAQNSSCAASMDTVPTTLQQSRMPWRTKVWAVNAILAALSTLYVGIVLTSASASASSLWNNNNNNTTHRGPVAAPPHVVWIPELSIATGLVLLAYGLLTYHAATHRWWAIHIVPLAFLLTTLVMWINFSFLFGLIQYTSMDNDTMNRVVAGAAQHAGLVLAVTVLPAYHAYRTHVPLLLVDRTKERRQRRIQQQQRALIVQRQRQGSQRTTTMTASTTTESSTSSRSGLTLPTASTTTTRKDVADGMTELFV